MTFAPRPAGGRDVRRPYLWLAAILAAAAALRTLGAASQGLWLDEGLTLVVSDWSARDMLLLPTDPTPALYYLLHKLFIPAHAPLLGIRSISIVCGVASVGLTYVLGRKGFGPRGGLIAAALLAVWTAHVDYSQEARAYSLLFMLTLAASVGVLTYAQATTAAGRRWGLALLAMGDVLSFYTHLTAAFWIVATSLILMGWALRARRPLGEVAVAFAVMGLLAAPGLYRLAAHGLHAPTFGWLPQASPGEFAFGLGEVMLPLGYWESPWLVGGRTALRHAVELLWPSALAGAFWRWGRGLAKHAAFPLIVAYLAMPWLIWGAGFVATPIFMPRTVLFTIPGLILLITGLCVGSPSPRLAALGLVAIYLGSTLAYGLMREKPDMRGAVRFLEASARPGDVVAPCAIYAYPTLRYHVRSVVGGMVLGTDYDGKLVKLEDRLGSDPAWDRRYFRLRLFPRMHAASLQYAPARLSMPPDRVLWQVENYCTPLVRARLEATLRRAGLACAPAWRSRDEANAVSVRRCVSRTSQDLPFFIPIPIG